MESGAAGAVAMCFTGVYGEHARMILLAESLAFSGYALYPILSYNADEIDTAFGTAASLRRRLARAAGREPIARMAEASALIRSGVVNLVLVAPCSGDTLLKLSAGLTDTPVTLAAAEQLAAHGALLVAPFTRRSFPQALTAAACLMERKGCFLAPFAQDKAGLRAAYPALEPAVAAAMAGAQLEPVLLGDPFAPCAPCPT